MMIIQYGLGENFKSPFPKERRYDWTGTLSNVSGIEPESVNYRAFGRLGSPVSIGSSTRFCNRHCGSDGPAGDPGSRAGAVRARLGRSWPSSGGLSGLQGDGQARAGCPDAKPAVSVE